MITTLNRAVLRQTSKGLKLGIALLWVAALAQCVLLLVYKLAPPEIGQRFLPPLLLAYAIPGLLGFLVIGRHADTLSDALTQSFIWRFAPSQMRFYIWLIAATTLLTPGVGLAVIALQLVLAVEARKEVETALVDVEVMAQRRKQLMTGD